MGKSNGRRRKRRRRGILGKLVSFVVILIAVLVGATVFFRASVIEVSGGSHYTEEELVEASGVETGDRLLFVNESKIRNSIKSRLPYVSDVSVSVQLPSTMKITIEENSVVAYISSDGENWGIDKNCKLLGTLEGNELGGIAQISGLTLDSPKEGGEISSENSSAVVYLEELIGLLADKDMMENVTAVDLTDLFNVTLNYLSRFTVKLGENEELAYKVVLLQGVMDEMDDNDSGTINVSNGESAVYSEE